MVVYKNIGIYCFKWEFLVDFILYVYEVVVFYVDKIKDSY